MSESMWNNGPDDPEFFERAAAKEKDAKLKVAQDVLDNFIKNDRLLSQRDLDRETEKFDEWMLSGSFGKFIDVAWEVFGGVPRNDRGLYSSWISAVEEAFDPESVSASIKSEAYLYIAKLSIRCKDGKLYDYEQRYDKEEFVLLETFHDKKLDFFRRFFNSEAMRHLKEWAHEVRLEHPYNNWDRYRDMSKVPLSELPEPAKMDPEKFKSLCDKLDKEAADGVRIPDNSSYNDSPCRLCTGECKTCTRPDRDCLNFNHREV